MLFGILAGLVFAGRTTVSVLTGLLLPVSAVGMIMLTSLPLIGWISGR